MGFIIRLLITAAVAFGLARWLEPHVTIDRFSTALIFVIVLSLLNMLVKPILVFFTLPITILTLGLFLIVINVLMILLASNFVDGIHIEGFWWALIYGFLLSVVSSALTNLLTGKTE